MTLESSSHTDPLGAQFWERLADYVAGDGTPAERTQFERWVAESPERRQALELAGAVWQDSPVSEVPVITDAAWEQVARRTQDFQSPVQRTTQHGRVAMKRPARRWSGMAVATAFVVLAGTWTYQRLFTSPEPAELVYHTAAGERKTVQLADGTRVTLAPETEIAVSGHRVLVQGEAFFDVAPQAERSLVIQTSNAEVRVLGTRFSVRNYLADHASRVVVEEGKVALHAVRNAVASAPIVLTANMFATVTDSGVQATQNANVANYTAWMQGRLVFDQVPLREAVAELNRAYGVEIRIADDTVLAQRRVTLTVAVDTQPVTQVLEFIGRVVNAHTVREGNTFHVRPGRVTVQEPVRRTPYPQSEKLYGK